MMECETLPIPVPDYLIATLNGKKTLEVPQLMEKMSTIARLERVTALVDEATIRGDKGVTAAKKIELQKLLKYDAIKPVKLTKEFKKGLVLLKSKLFSVEKKDANHEFKLNRARLVGRGDLWKDKPTSELETFSPTVSSAAVMSTLSVVLERKYDYMVVDVESAYLNANFKDGVYMKLDRPVAQLMVELDGSYMEFLEDDGSMIVQVTKALYGLQQSAKLWYETLMRSLIAIGFQRSNYDQAVFFKSIGDEKVIILVYVDDMLITGPKGEILKVKSEMEKTYTLKSSEVSPKEVDYIGMKIQYDQEDASFLLSQPGMISKVTAGVKGVSDLPCDKKLYQETDPEPFADVHKYRSQLMEMNYLAKTRIDLKVAICALATKMQNPTKGDYEKMLKLKRYINGTKDLKLRIKAVGEIQVYASADAAYGPFPDGKSISGVVLTIGTHNAPVYAKSGKQKSVANSSTASELIALSTSVEEVLWLTKLLDEMGFKQGPVEIEQDNQSTILTANKGPTSTGRSKWINIKHFWVKQHLESDDVRLKYVKSLDMLADGLTKPLVGEAFHRWRDRILNAKMPEETNRHPN